jgi:hypothetical protein
LSAFPSMTCRNLLRCRSGRPCAKSGPEHA